MSDLRHDCRSRYEPTAEEVADLVERSGRHELGLDFLRYGSQDSVAAAFGVHAFTVDAARKQLAEVKV